MFDTNSPIHRENITLLRDKQILFTENKRLKRQIKNLEKRLFIKARGSITWETAYTDDEMLNMFGPFILKGITEGLSVRECRLIETVADANAEIDKQKQLA